MSEKRRSLTFLCGLLILAIFSDSIAQWASDADAQAKAREALTYLQGIGVDIDTERGEALLIESAELGFAPAQLTLGEAYLFGNVGLTKNDELAWLWLNRALEHDLPLAKYYIALFYNSGRIVREDKQKAFRLTMEAAEEGVSDAYKTLGKLYWDGDGVTKNDQQAIKWLRRAAEFGDLDVIAHLALIYLYGDDSIKPDPVAAIKYLTQGSELGDPWAQSKLGSAYLEGDGVEQNTSRAIELLTASAEAGEPFAMYDLGTYLLTSPNENTRNPSIGVYWLENALRDERVRKSAAQILAEAFRDGVGVEIDHGRAIELYLEGGNPVGAAHLLVYGEGEVRDIERAISVLTKCHETGQYGGCATFLGRMYGDISSDLYNPSVASAWFEKGAEAGDVGAFLELSKIYTLGMGVTLDFDAAAAYLDAAIEKNDDPSSIAVGIADIHLAYAKLHLLQGNSRKAEGYFQKGLVASADTDDQDTVILTVLAMNDLGGLYLQQGRFAAALKLYSELRQRVFSDNDTKKTAELLGTIGTALTYNLMGDLDRSKAIVDNDPVIQVFIDNSNTSLEKAMRLVVIGSLQFRLERNHEASQSLEMALPILQKQLGAESFISLSAAGILGSVNYALGQIDEAERLLSETIEGVKLAGLDDTFMFSYAQAELAKVLQASGKQGQARILIEDAVAGIIRRSNDNNQSTSIGSVTERRRAKEVFSTYVELSGKARDSERHEEIDKTFAIVQFAMSLTVDEAIRNWTQRSNSTDPRLAKLIQSLSLAQDRSRAIDQLYQRAILSDAPERQAIGNQLSDVDAEIKKINTSIGNMGFRVADLRETQPVSISDVQALLEEGELLLLYMTAKEKSYGWSISRNRATSFEVDADQSTLRLNIGTLRASLVSPESGGLNEYPIDIAHWLFEKVVRPGLVDHPETTKLIIVPDGPLIGIPFPALRLSELPSIDSTGIDSGWLISHYAISLVPSVASLRSLRIRVSASNATKSFLGFGDPDLGVVPDDSSVQFDTYSAYYDTRGFGDPSRLNSLNRLPETADELRELALLLNGSEDDVYLGQDATETKLKGISLQDFRVLAFATHGLLAGSIVGHGEPALVLTPPTKASILDDGLLTASEIAMLKLDADIVILSACDTAAGGANSDAMGLSGLARAFFLAGTRNVLASNWPVNSDAARQLTTAMFDSIKVDPDLSYPEALQSAMLKVQNDAGTELARHPVYWAPFVVIGQ